MNTAISTLVRKHFEIAYTVPDGEAATICAGIQSQNRDDDNPVYLFPHEGGVVAAVELSGEGLEDEDALMQAKVLALDEILNNLPDDAVVYPKPHRIVIVDHEATEKNLRLGSLPPLDPKPYPVAVSDESAE